MCPDLAKSRHLGNILKVLGDYVSACLVLGKILNLLWSTFYAIGQIFIVANGLILTYNLVAQFCVLTIFYYICSLYQHVLNRGK